MPDKLLVAFFKYLDKAQCNQCD